MLSRKTGQPAEDYSGWTRAAIITELERLEPADTQGVSTVPAVVTDEIRALKKSYEDLAFTVGKHTLGLQTLNSTLTDSQYRIDQAEKRIQNDLVQRVRDIQQDLLTAITKINEQRVVREIVVVRNDVETKIEGRQHKDFKDLLSLIATKQKVMLVGPAGSGKTEAAIQAAKALGMSFSYTGAIDNEYKLMGFVDAQGRITSTSFRKAFTQGGLWLWDEVDASLPPAVLAFNAATGNNMCDFPGESDPIPAHPDFVCMLAGNTFYGADHQYVGRMKQDAAFLDRFLVMDWHYDNDLERGICQDLWDTQLAKDWVSMVIKTREVASQKGLHVVVSPRASIGGVKLLRSGVSWDMAVRVTLRKTMKPADWEKISDSTRQPFHTPVDPLTGSKPTMDEYLKRIAQREVKMYPDPQIFQVKSHGKVHKDFYKKGRDLL